MDHLTPETHATTPAAEPRTVTRIVRDMDDPKSFWLERSRQTPDGHGEIFERELLQTHGSPKLRGPAKATNAGHNVINRERYVTCVQIRNFREIPRFVIDSNTFRFDSHGDTTGWILDVKQRWHDNRPTKLVVTLRNAEDGAGGGCIHIRMHRHDLGRRIERVEDVAELFQHPFSLVQANKFVQATPGIDACSDEQLLAELQRRTLARLGDYRGQKHERPTNNVIDFDSIRRREYSDERILAILAS